MTFPYKSPLGFGYESGGEESDTVIANGLGMYDDEPEHKMKKKHKPKPDAVAKNEAPVNISLNFNMPRDHDDTFRMKGGLEAMSEDKAEQLRQAINAPRVPAKRFASMDAMMEMYYELSPLERRLALKHLTMAASEKKKK